MRAGDPGRRDQITLRSRTLTAAMLCLALCLAAGCGSSSDSGASGSGGAGHTSGTANATGTTATDSTSSTAGSTGAAPKSGKPPTSSGLKYNTTPKYAKPSSSAPVQSGVVQIAYRNIAIDPDTLRVKAGSTVRW